MPKDEEIKKEQLTAAEKLAQYGVDPDTIMVTYTPEEYAKMYEESIVDFGYVLSEETVDTFPISLLGSKPFLETINLSIDSFASARRISSVELYLKAVKNAVAKASEDEYDIEDLYEQISIQRIIAKALQTALAYYEKEYQDDTKTYNETKNYWQKTELNQDMNNCLHIITNIKNIIAVNEDFCEVLENKTSELGKAR